jgi:multiple sugar transport system ATP-binding protein
MNFVEGTIEKKGSDLYFNFGNASLKLPPEKSNESDLQEYAGKQVIGGIRPESIHDEPTYLSQYADWVVDTRVEVTELMGNEIFLYLVTEEQPMVARVSPRSSARAEDNIKIALDISRIHIFDKDTEKCIVH